jgi:hypothetical protein
LTRLQRPLELLQVCAAVDVRTPARRWVSGMRIGN